MKQFLIILCLSLTSILMAGPSPEVMKKRMLSDLDFIKASFEVKYAPSLWKKEFADWSIDAAHEEARQKVLKLKNPRVKDFQIILKEFFQSPKDYHVGVLFFSTERASLPFTVRGAEHNFFVVHSTTPQIMVGDEVLEFNGMSVCEAISELKKSEVGSNTKETDQSLAEILLTARNGALGHVVPKGEVDVKVKRKRNGNVETVSLHWNYTEEKIPELHKGKPAIYANRPLETMSQEEQIKAFFNKMMLGFPHSFLKAENNYDIGAKSSFIPPLGKKVWEASKDAPFDAYIFRVNDAAFLPAHKKEMQLGYIRIPHYMGDDEEAEEFGKIISFLQSKTDALVIDQLNNPGGSIFYMYGLAAMLTDKPLYPPKHRIAMTQEDVNLAVLLLALMENIRNDYEAKLVLAPTLGGYTIDYQFVVSTRQFCHFLLKEWKEGRIYSEPTHLFGFDALKPHPKIRYTKPILVLINELDFSCGDFFPAILQDNKRAKLLGTRTAGAGGYVLGTSFYNLIGLNQFQLTGSSGLRLDKDPLENLGVKPDISCALTEKDLREDYRPYIETVLKSLKEMTY